MAHRDPETPETADPTETVDCVSYRLRRAARKAAKLYDGALKPSGLRNTQFTLLGALGVLGEPSIGELSDELAIDGTTLTRNLEVVVRRGLVDNIEAEDGRVRKVRLTEAGKTAFAEAVPLWRQAQRRVLEALGPERRDGMRSDLETIEAVCEDDGQDPGP